MSISADEAKRLHDRATRGLELSPDERSSLEAWYARQDAAESEALAAGHPSPTLKRLRAEIGETVSRLRALADQIEAQASENEQLREENRVLQRRLAERSAVPRV